MGLPTLVQWATGTNTAILDDPPTPGNLLVLVKMRHNTPPAALQTGFTDLSVFNNAVGNPRSGRAMYRVVQSGDDENVGSGAELQVDNTYYLMEWSDAAIDDFDVQDSQADSQPFTCGGSITPPTGEPVVILGAANIFQGSNEPDVVSIAPLSDVIEIVDTADGATHDVHWLGYLEEETPSGGGYNVGGTTTNEDARDVSYAGISIVLVGSGDPDPEPEDPDEPPPYVPPPPDVGALLEIWVAEAGAARWDVALWDEDVWSSSGWTDITYLGVTADVSWGVDNAERGILAPTVAGVWTVDTHDPDRILDPGNAESPYATELVPGLPIRLSVAGRRVLRTGVVDTMSYSHAARGGRIRATDAIARMAATGVSESDLGVIPDTLYARSLAAIEAAGLDVQVSPVPSTGDPSLAPLDVSGDRTVWDVIASAALETLRTPYLNEHGVLYFRRWALPLSRGLQIASPELVDLQSFVSAEGLYSAVRVNDATAMSTVELAITPPPPYGRRLHERSDPTISGEVWADTVLTDRSGAALRWRPGQIRPLTAERVVQIGSISHNELVTLLVPEADPVVEVSSRVLGTQVRVIDLGGPGPDGVPPNTQWRFQLLATTGSVEPLIADGVTPDEVLVDDDDDAPLYADGVAASEEV